MDISTQSGASGNPEVDAGTLNDSAVALTELSDERYAQKQAAFTTRGQSLLDKFGQSGGGSIFIQAEQNREQDGDAINGRKIEKEEAIWNEQRGADSPSLFPGNATYLDRFQCKIKGTGDPAEVWVSPFDQETHYHFVGGVISGLAENFRRQNEDNAFVAHHIKDFAHGTFTSSRT